MDNYFSSPRSFKDMLGEEFYCIDTARAYRKGSPTSLNYGNNQQRGILHARVYKDKDMAAFHWTDCKRLHLLSTKADPVEAELHVPRHV